MQTEILGYLLAFVKQCFPECFEKVKRRMMLPCEFKGVLAELALLFALFPGNAAMKANTVPYGLKYDAGSGSPDIIAILEDERRIGIEVTHLEVRKPVDHAADDPRPVDLRIKEAMHKLDAELEGKVGRCANCDVEVLALDISDYVRRVFLVGDTSLIDNHLESYLYGQAKVRFDIIRGYAGARNVEVFRDGSELPTVKGSDVAAFFSRRPDVASVIYFWHCFQHDGKFKGYTYPVKSKIAVNTNPATPDEKRIPWSLAFALANALNGDGPFVADQLYVWGIKHV